MAKLIRVWDGSAWQEVGTAIPNGLTTDGTQTLTNKTITLGNNTITGTTAEFNTALSDANFATLAGTETLTNKTINLTSNTLSGTTAQFNTALSDANFTTLTGSETLTNKTISGADNTLTNIGNSSLTNSAITVNGSAVSLGGSVTIVTGPASSAVSSNITMAANNNYFVDTSAARTLTLPASPTLGDTIAIYDASGTAATNNITIARNGNKINGQTENAIIDVDQSSSIFTYTGSTLGWRFD